MRRIKAIAVTGPTASGKTDLSIGIARAVGGEIVCLDSMQIYRRMDIGTAKATAEEQASVAHHMLDILPPEAPYSAHDYKRDASVVCEDIVSRGKIPIFVGGTGLYLDTLRRRGDAEAPEASAEYREALLLEVRTEADRVRLHERLREVDPESAEKIHYNNLKRVIRALEIFERTGIKKSRLDELSSLPDERFDILHITLDFHSRDTLYQRIDERVLRMFDEGLCDEALTLYKEGAFPEGSTARFAIGYKEIIDAYLENKPLTSAIPTIMQATRNYAKRQLTWFRRDAEAIRLYPDDERGKMKPKGALLKEALTTVLNYNF